MNPTRPVMRYFGGKWNLAPWIISYFPAHRVYVEPFGGVASVLLQKPRSYAEVYNDLDGEVVNLFRVLRNPRSAAELEYALTLTPYSRDEFELASSAETVTDPVERARRLVAMTGMAFGSSGTNKTRASFRAVSHKSNSAHARAWSNVPNQVARYCARMAGVTIEHKDALEIIRQQDRDDTLFYVDPPYPAETRGSQQMYRHEMSEQQHRNLGALLKSVRGMVVLSTYDSPLYAEMFKGWHVVSRPALADGARSRTELLYINPACSAVARAQQLAAL